jgi:hypothetical protein
MNPSALRRFSERAVRERVKLFPARVRFRGVEVDVVFAPSDPTLTLGRGGFTEDAPARFRFPGAIEPAPAAQEEITDMDSGKVLVVLGVIPGRKSNSLAAEHIVTATSA